MSDPNPNAVCQERRYAPDGELYSREEFQEFYGQLWGEYWKEAEKEVGVSIV